MHRSSCYTRSNSNIDYNFIYTFIETSATSSYLWWIIHIKWQTEIVPKKLTAATETSTHQQMKVIWRISTVY